MVYIDLDTKKKKKKKYPTLWLIHMLPFGGEKHRQEMLKSIKSYIEVSELFICKWWKVLEHCKWGWGVE